MNEARRQRREDDASALVFLVAETEQTYQGCRIVLRALGQAREIRHRTEPDAAAKPWADLNALLGHATREFQNSARAELGVAGPIAAWHGPALAGREG